MQITNSLIAKSGAAALAAGGAGFAGGKIGSQKSEKEIVSKYLTRIGRTPASDADGESLKDFYAKETDSRPISGIPKANIASESIKGWCLSELAKVAEEQTEAHLLLIESGCSKPQKLSERLSAIGKVKLDTEGSQSPSEGAKYVEEYKTSSAGKTIQKKSSSGDRWEDFESNTVDEQILKNGCKEHEGSHFKHRKDVLFEKYVRWCSK